ncbi:MAG TPA: hypothetical protein DGX96_06240 [Lachnospiraceae bacterium]|jgi:hypothetical protein|nr:hypothetical protein [Lachnospiraceae bacterium]
MDENKEMDSENMEDMDAMADLDAMFGQDDEMVQKAEKTVLTQNLEGFASCFPDWDLHPPVGY